MRPTRNRTAYTVAKASNLLYRIASSPRGQWRYLSIGIFENVADWKSAIQQAGNLRYVDV